MAFSINVHVSPRAAILAGKTQVGAQTCNISEEGLSRLSEDLRLELALAYEAGEMLGKDASEPAIVEATIDAIIPVLAYRAEQRKKRENEAKVAAAREAEAQAVSAKEQTAKDNARSKALRVWVDKHGDDEQKARMAEGFLPEDEILDEVCAELLDLPGFQEYDPLRKGDACECACAGRVVITTGAPRYMDAHQFSRLQTARESLPENASVEVVEHRAACPACNCVPIARLEARVTMPWHGWLLVRQYALT